MNMAEHVDPKARDVFASCCSGALAAFTDRADVFDDETAILGVAYARYSSQRLRCAPSAFDGRPRCRRRIARNASSRVASRH